MTETGTEKYFAARKFYESLMRSQWLPAERIIAYQETQLQQMLSHAWAQVPFYREPLDRIRGVDGRFDLTRWNELPVIDKETVMADPEAFKARALPQAHQATLNTSTSGSEGRALPITKTRFEHTGIACASYRYAGWFGYDYKTPLAMIRSGFIRPADTGDPEDKLWGPPWIDAGTRGARHRLHIHTPVAVQLDWLMELGPVYLNTLPSNAMALIQHSEETGRKPAVKGIMSIGEKLTKDVRDEAMRVWGCRISDVYATNETGIIAVECPGGGGHHLQTEITKTEVIGGNGLPCGPGETGFLVCTSIYNFAMPMIRYRFNDLATVGEPCKCRRGLARLSDIIGRRASQFMARDGSLYAPDISTREMFRLSGAREWQIDQQSPDKFAVKLKRSAPVSGSQRSAVIRYIAPLVHKNAEISIETVEGFPRSTGGKFFPVVRSF